MTRNTIKNIARAPMPKTNPMPKTLNINLKNPLPLFVIELRPRIFSDSILSCRVSYFNKKMYGVTLSS